MNVPAWISVEASPKSLADRGHSIAIAIKTLVISGINGLLVLNGRDSVDKKPGVPDDGRCRGKDGVTCAPGTASSSASGFHRTIATKNRRHVSGHLNYII